MRATPPTGCSILTAAQLRPIRPMKLFSISRPSCAAPPTERSQDGSYGRHAGARRSREPGIHQAAVTVERQKILRQLLRLESNHSRAEKWQTKPRAHFRRGHRTVADRQEAYPCLASGPGDPHQIECRDHKD